MKFLICLFIRFHYWLNSKDIRIKGLGFVQRLLNKEFEFESLDSRFFYDPAIVGSYDYLLIGKPNEPETHTFLSKVIPLVESVSFVDIGASIGEFAITVCKYPNVKIVFAFEPRPECVQVLRKNAALNNEKRIKVYENAVSEKVGYVQFHLNPGGTDSGIYSSEDNFKTLNVKAINLDNVLPENLLNPIILMDVEGAEPLVIKGGLGFIRHSNPLIIFEYNNNSKRHYNIDSISSMLDSSYNIYRLTSNGYLDMDFTNSWNCVAVSQRSLFYELIKPLIKTKN